MTPHLIRLTEKCRRSNYCYANGPKIKLQLALMICHSLFRERIFNGALCNCLFWDFCITMVAAFKFVGQSDQMRCQNFSIRHIICELWEWHIIRINCNFYFRAICRTIVTSFKFCCQSAQMRYQTGIKWSFRFLQKLVNRTHHIWAIIKKQSG